jgi:hypothetical protein
MAAWGQWPHAEEPAIARHGADDRGRRARHWAGLWGFRFTASGRGRDLPASGPVKLEFSSVVASRSRSRRATRLAAPWKHGFLRTTKWLKLLIGVPDPLLNLPYLLSLHWLCAGLWQFGPRMD